MTDQAFGNILWNFLAIVGELVSSIWFKANQGLQKFCVVCSNLLRMNSNLVGIQSEWREQLEDEGTTLKWKKSFKLVTDQVIVIIYQTG